VLFECGIAPLGMMRISDHGEPVHSVSSKPKRIGVARIERHLHRIERESGVHISKWMSGFMTAESDETNLVAVVGTVLLTLLLRLNLYVGFVNSG
jgi:hypothetical protein